MNNQLAPQAFIFIGRSGSGKGTQVKLLREYLKKIDSAKESLYVYGGKEFREFIKGPLLTQQLSKAIYDVGGLQPEFLAVYMWANFLVKDYTKNEHLVIDGMPRRYHEAGVLDSIFDFYKLPKPFVIYLDITKDEALRRLLARKRVDDNVEEINTRLSWFDTEVLPALNFYKNNPKYTLLEVNGEKSPEEIHANIVSQLNF